MQYNNNHFKKILTKPINLLIDAIIESVHFLSPIKNDSYRRNVKYTIRDYVIGIIDVLKKKIIRFENQERLDELGQLVLERLRQPILYTRNSVICVTNSLSVFFKL